jgi:hypothetical protein
VHSSDKSRNWVFLGDSLTEGVGSKRVSHVTELANQLRSSNGDTNVHELRLRHVDVASFNRDIEFNVAGLMNMEVQRHASDLWLWNLACEGQTINSDFGWLPLIAALRPELVVIFRGSLESIIRPAMLNDGDWPWWVPPSWRGYAAMDPRCYFSTTWWRKAKQSSIDAMKQRVRLKLLQDRPAIGYGAPCDLPITTHPAAAIARHSRSRSWAIACGPGALPGIAGTFSNGEHPTATDCGRGRRRFF